MTQILDSQLISTESHPMHFLLSIAQKGVFDHRFYINPLRWACFPKSMFLHTKGKGDVQCTLCTPFHLYTDSVNLFSSTFEFKMAGYKVTSLLRCWGELPERWLYKPHPGGLPCTYRSIFEVVTSISKKFTSFIEKWAKGRGGPIKTSKNKWRKKEPMLEKAF